VIGRIALNGYRTWARVRDRAFSRACQGAFASFGPRSVVQLPVRLAGESRISIGSDVFIAAGSWFQALGEDSEIVIEDGVVMSGFCSLSAVRSIRLGKRAMIGRYVLISDHAHEFGDAGVPILDQGIRDIGAVVIGNSAWVGQSVFVAPGVRIGHGAVIGANSVVLSDVPDYSVAVGVPARVTRTFDRNASPLT
jgi:acetyltransferase-like isoleucine patch superfamily enzyme